jgi:Amt family ammonium transporter
MFMEWVRHGKPSVLGIVTGMVAGLGTITPASGFVGPLAALIIGFTAGVVCYLATAFIKRTLKIDDSLDVFPVHGVGGIIGTLFAGLFVGTLGGAGLAEGVTTAGQVWVQFIGVAATFVWCAVLTWIILKLIDAVIGLRVSSDQETEGLDIVLHDETGYNL